MTHQNSRSVILYIAMSLDGYIAGPGDDLSFLDKVRKEGEDYGFREFTDSVDVVILGRRTYEKVASMGYENPYDDRKVYVLTQRPGPDK